MTEFIHITKGVNVNSVTDEYIDFSLVKSTGTAEPTSRVLDGSYDAGYTQEWVEPCVLPDGRKGEIVYLFDDDDLLDADGNPIEEAENLPFDSEHVMRIKLSV